MMQLHRGRLRRGADLGPRCLLQARIVTPRPLPPAPTCVIMAPSQT